MRQRSRAFTLIELLVVIAIIAILAAILFPVFAQAKMAAKKTSAISDMKQTSLSVIMYSSDYDDITMPRLRLGFGPPTGGDVSNAMGWEMFIQPYMKNWNMLTSGVDARPKYSTPYGGQWRRSYAVAGNSFKGVQVATNHPWFWSGGGGLQSGWSFTGFPQPADTIMMGEKRMLHRTMANYWQQNEWIQETWIVNTRNSTQPPGNKILGEWGDIDAQYGGGAVWSYMDGHAKWVAARGRTSDGAASGTPFPGYENRSGTWDQNGASFLEWTGGQVCMDAEWYNANASRDCRVPGQ